MSVSGLESHVRRFVDGRMTKEKGGPKAALSFARSPILRRAGKPRAEQLRFRRRQAQTTGEGCPLPEMDEAADAFLSNSRGTP